MKSQTVVALLFVTASSCCSYGVPSLFKSDRFTALSVSSLADVRMSLISILSPSSSSLVDDGGYLQSETDKNPAKYSKLKELVSILELSQTRDLMFPSLWAKIDGDWDLKYTNNAESFIEAGAGLSGGIISKKTNVIDVVQRINMGSNCVDHILKYTIPFTTYSGSITLRHDMIVTSDVAPAQLAIDLSEIIIDGPLNPLNLPSIRLPGPSYLRRGVFDVSSHITHF